MASWNSVAASIAPRASRLATVAEATVAARLSDGAWMGAGTRPVQTQVTDQPFLRGPARPVIRPGCGPAGAGSRQPREPVSGGRKMIRPVMRVTVAAPMTVSASAAACTGLVITSRGKPWLYTAGLA